MGMGPFAPKVDYAAGSRPESVFSVDLDGDGDNDLAVANLGSDNVSVLLNLSDVIPSLAVTSINPTSGLELEGTSVTITGSNFQSGATVIFGESDATNVAVGLWGTITATTPAHPVGIVDVTVTNPDGQAGTLSNGFAFIGVPPIVTSIDPIFGTKLGGTSVTIKGRDFQSGATVTFGDRAATDVVIVSSSTITAVIPAHPISTVDVIVTNPNGLTDTLSDGFAFVDVLFGPRTDYAVGGSPESVFITDLDGDGDDDLAVANWNSDNVSVLLNNGNGTFAPKVDYAVGEGPISIFSVDLDGDGDNELVVANLISENVSVLLNSGDGAFPFRADYDAGNEPASVFSTDLDGDGDNDLATANIGSDSVSVLLNNGNGTFAPKMNYAVGDSPISIFSVDLDGDGDNDLAVANENSDNVSVLLNDGNGTFEINAAYSVGNGPVSVFSADLDGDGNNDLVVTNRWSDSVSVLLNISDFTVVPDLVGDFDGDNEVGLSDFVRFLDVFGTTTSSVDWDSAYDLDSDGEVGLSDFVIFLDNFGTTG